ncbi:recombinase [Budviciaceae bacterium BWR-B9]|uniref:Recombinase n=1 Tax=Limnobaculum allomyrinae TaxID=2791986 RepID=A0ABS1IVU2_9GAMM|nr:MULTISPECIES: recombinase [Limnobaculum]MBK5145875.1 recombinase [Limnobaculum allomyrinae]MBV7693886.1 recombinase [Limnobaculum sp. M2-1]
MSRNVTQSEPNPDNGELMNASAKWDSCKPPYTSQDIKICVTAAKTILLHSGKPRRSKYEKDSYLRIDFSKAGKVTFYAEFPKVMGLKGRKLGEWPEMAVQIARERASDMASEGLKAESVQQVITLYENDLAGKVTRGKLGQNSYETYCCRTRRVAESFSERTIFSDISYNDLINVLDMWVSSKSNNQAIELFAELRRLWKFGAPKFCNGRNVAASLPDDYISSRVQRPMPTRLYTDIESIAALWINVAACSSIHQKNAVRAMILTGVRPVNINNLSWDFVAEDLSEIVYPAGVMGMRGAMKTQKEFRLPVTVEMRQILEEQKAWRDSVPDCNKEYVFLQPRNPSMPFAKRSLDKLIKTYSPEDAVKGVKHAGTVKGSAGAFNTMCRKFLKSNVIIQMRARGFSRSDAREISQLCMHHSDRKDDPMGEHYDFSDEITQEEMKLKRIAFEAHEASIMAQVALIKRRG